MKKLDEWIDELLLPYWKLAQKQFKKDASDWADPDFYLAPVTSCLRTIDDWISEGEKKKFYNVSYYDGLYSDEDMTGIVAFSPAHALVIAAVENTGDFFFEEIMHGEFSIEDLVSGKGKVSVAEVEIENNLICKERLGEVHCHDLLRQAGWKFDGDLVCFSVILSLTPVFL